MIRKFNLVPAEDLKNTLVKVTHDRLETSTKTSLNSISWSIDDMIESFSKPIEVEAEISIDQMLESLMFKDDKASLSEVVKKIYQLTNSKECFLVKTKNSYEDNIFTIKMPASEFTNKLAIQKHEQALSLDTERLAETLCFLYQKYESVEFPQPEDYATDISVYLNKNKYTLSEEYVDSSFYWSDDSKKIKIYCPYADEDGDDVELNLPDLGIEYEF